MSWDGTNNRIGFGTTVPTNTITLSSSSTGIAAFNTSDQVTNFQNVVTGWSSNIYGMVSSAGGSIANPLPLQFSVISTTGGSTYRQFTIYDVTTRINAGSGIFDFTNGVSVVAGATNALRGSYIGSSTFQQALGIYPTVNQSSTATFSAIFVSPYFQTAVNTPLLLNLGTNTSADNTGTHTPKFTVDLIGNIVTSNTATNGYTLFNTSDQITNFEDARMSWNSNIFKIGTTAGGTGTIRSTQILSGPIGITVDSQATLLSIASKINLGFGSSAIAAGAGLVSATGTVTSTSSVQNVFGITATVNQSSTGGANLLYISPYLQATGSGGTYLINVGTNSAANASGTHTPKFQVDLNGTTTSASNFIGGFSTTASGSANFGSTSGTGFATATSTALLQYAGSTSVNYRTWMAGSTSTTMNAVAYVNFIVGSSPITIPVTGGFSWASNAVINPIGTITNLGAGITNTATLYVGNASAAGTNNYSLYVAGGQAYFGGAVSINGDASARTTTNKSFTYSLLPTSPSVGMQSVVTDSTVNTWGSSVTVGGGSNTVLVWYNGTNWSVYGK